MRACAAGTIVCAILMGSLRPIMSICSWPETINAQWLFGLAMYAISNPMVASASTERNKEAAKFTGPSARSVNLFVFSLIAVLVGIVTGFGAIFFRGLIACNSQSVFPRSFLDIL